MEYFIKKGFVLFPLFVIAVCAYFAARGTNNVVRVYLAGDGVGKEEAVVPASPATTGDALESKSDPALTTNLSMNPWTGERIEQQDLLPVELVDVQDLTSGEEQSAAKDPTILASKIDCGFSVLSGTLCEPISNDYGFLGGTLVSSNPRESSAMVYNSKDKRPYFFELNQVIAPGKGGEGDANGARVAKICRNKVYLELEGKLYCLTSEADSEALSKQQEVGEEPTAPPPEGAGIEKVSDTEYKVAKGEIDNALNNMDKLATQARMVPHFQGGKSVGFRVYAIKPGSLFSNIGLQNGDIVERINGMDINSPEKALEIYTKLREAKSISIDLKRRGRPSTLEYSIY